MTREATAIDIALNDRPIETDSSVKILAPLSSTDSLVATRGLAEHLEILHRGVLKSSSPERALEGIYDFLVDDVEKSRTRSKNLERAFDIETSHLRYSKAYTAAAITYLLRGQRAHKTGVWLKDKAAERQLKIIYAEVMGAKSDIFAEMAVWGLRRTRENSAYWRQQLEAIRQHPLINQLREAIESSDHVLTDV